MKQQNGFRGERTSHTILTVVFSVIAVAYLYPIFIVLVNSLKSNAAINTATFALPNGDSFMLKLQHDETLQETSPERLHECLGLVVMMEINDRWTATKKRQAENRRAFYFSAEYLVGRLVYSNLFNMGILEEVKKAFAEKGVDLACLEEIEDAALGNGGLGRLAACFLDSAATCSLPLTGYGLRYRFGLFKQTFEHDSQRETADDWTKYGDPWSHRRDKLAVRVKFADQTVVAVPYDMSCV